MRTRTYILLILVLLVGAAAVVLVVLNRSGRSVTDLLPGGQDDAATPIVIEQPDGEEPGLPPPTVTPVPQFRDVVVSRIRLPIGTMLTEEYLTVEARPITNIAIQGNYTFTSTEQLEGRVARVEIARGQEVLEPMLAEQPTDIAALGSDLAVNIPPGELAIAFPLGALDKSVALAMRPGDQVDMIMTLRTVAIDPEFRSALPNNVAVVIESDLLAGQAFLYDEFVYGRLEFVPELNQVATIIPGGSTPASVFDEQDGEPIPKQVTQLTIQRAQVLWVGNWADPRIADIERDAAAAVADANAAEGAGPLPTPTPLPSRAEETPQVVILSLTAQEALALKWARDESVEIALALRSPEDATNYVTASVSLPQIIDLGALSIPEPMEFDLINPDED